MGWDELINCKSTDSVHSAPPPFVILICGSEYGILVYYYILPLFLFPLLLILRIIRLHYATSESISRLLLIICILWFIATADSSSLWLPQLLQNILNFCITIEFVRRFHSTIKG